MQTNQQTTNQTSGSSPDYGAIFGKGAGPLRFAPGPHDTCLIAVPFETFRSAARLTGRGMLETDLDQLVSAGGGRDGGSILKRQAANGAGIRRQGRPRKDATQGTAASLGATGVAAGTEQQRASSAGAEGTGKSRGGWPRGRPRKAAVTGQEASQHQ